MSDEKTIAVVPDLKAPIKLNITKAAITKLKTKYKIVPDAGTKEGYEAIQNAKRELVPLRTAAEKEAKLQKEAAQTHINNINKELNFVVDSLKAIEKPLYDEKKRVDDLAAEEKRKELEKEQRRVDAIEGMVEDIQNLTEGLLGADLEILKSRMEEANAITITASVYMEFVEPASLVLDQAKTQLTNAVNMAKQAATQKAETDKQREGLDAQQRENDLKDSINRIKMAPVDLMGKPVADIQSASDKLDGIDVNESYGEHASQAALAVTETKHKLEAMIAQQQTLDDQQADIDRQKKEHDDKVEADQKEQEQKDEEARKELEAEAMADELKARLPEDQRLREWAQTLGSSVTPNILDEKLKAVLAQAVSELESIKDYVFDHTQSGH